MGCLIGCGQSRSFLNLRMPLYPMVSMKTKPFIAVQRYLP